jgi:ubiquinone/menaquinone biosynthesis C-methylase UbiE
VTGDAAFEGSIPEIYDRYLTPLIFESYAQDLARRLRPSAPARILEIAAGTGVATRAMAAASPGSRIVSTDLNQAMLDRAAAIGPDDGRVTWRQANALALPFENESFDAVACQFGAMFFPDRRKAYREALRVLKPGGMFVFSVWDRIERNEFAQAVTDALAMLYPDDPPRFLARTPHGYHDKTAIVADARAAGFTKIAIETVEERSRAPSPREPAVGYCQGTPLRGEIAARDRSGLDRATGAAERAIAARFGGGPVEGLIAAHVVSCVR